MIYHIKFVLYSDLLLDNNNITIDFYCILKKGNAIAID